MATTSNHLQGAAELMLVANIKGGFVQHPERLVSYATRLGQLLDVLLQGRRLAAEVNRLTGSRPLERRDTSFSTECFTTQCFSTQFAIRQRPQRAELIVSAIFDGSWEAYGRNLQKTAGDLLDAIFCHCEGYEGHTCVDDGYEKFSAWLRDRQVQTRFFRKAAPDPLTMGDLPGERRFVAGDVDSRVANAGVPTEAPVGNARSEPDDGARQAQAIKRQAALNSMLVLAGSFPESERVSPRRTARQTYEAAITSLIGSSPDPDLQKRAREMGLLSNGPLPVEKPAAAPPSPATEPGLNGFEEQGRRVISAILEIEDHARQRDAWKEVLEEQPDRLADAGAVWAAIRNPSMSGRLARDFPKYAQAFESSPRGTLPTPYGLLVSHSSHARQILGDDGSQFSVAQYWKRLDATIKGHYLGRDATQAKYAEQAPGANEYLSSSKFLPPDGVYRAANEGARTILSAPKSTFSDVPASVDIRELALHGIGCVGQQYLVTPDLRGGDLATFVKLFVPISRYCFQPYPDQALEQQAKGAGKLLVPDGEPAVLRGPFADHLRNKVKGVYADPALVRSAVIGAMVGFAPPAVGHVIGILMRWLMTGELQRHGRKSPEARQRAVIEAMTETPVPPIVYRTIAGDARLDGLALAPAAQLLRYDYVVIGTQSVALDARQERLTKGGAHNDGNEWQWLFAGDRTDTSQTNDESSRQPAVHGCPARTPAVRAICGIIDALSEYPDASLCGPLQIIVGAATPRGSR